ncbi:MAG: hypothetical protein FLDDKLPJ_03258 [Phycisphaerae bacterium]|nr:hypothetical protein [Phycisphaerae bacterium]
MIGALVGLGIVAAATAWYVRSVVLGWMIAGSIVYLGLCAAMLLDPVARMWIVPAAFFSFPWWAAGIATVALIPGRLLRRIRPPRERDPVRRGRYPRGLCHACGYDLTGNVSGACPECGARRPASEWLEEHLTRWP